MMGLIQTIVSSAGLQEDGVSAAIAEDLRASVNLPAGADVAVHNAASFYTNDGTPEPRVVVRCGAELFSVTWRLDNVGGQIWQSPEPGEVRMSSLLDAGLLDDFIAYCSTFKRRLSYDAYISRR